MTNRFVVDLSGVKLPKETSRLLQTRIQTSVLDVLAGLPHEGDLHIRFPREWLGIVLSQELSRLGDLDKQIGKQLQF